MAASNSNIRSRHRDDVESRRAVIDDTTSPAPAPSPNTSSIIVRNKHIIIPLIIFILAVITISSNHARKDDSLNTISLTQSEQTTDKNDFGLARTQSFGFFDDIPAYQWKHLHQIFVEHVNHRYPEKPFTTHPEAGREQSDPLVWPYTRRVGSNYKSVQAWYQNVSNCYIKRCNLYHYSWLPGSEAYFLEQNYEPNFSCRFEKRVGIPMNGYVSSFPSLFICIQNCIL